MNLNKGDLLDGKVMDFLFEHCIRSKQERHEFLQSIYGIIYTNNRLLFSLNQHAALNNAGARILNLGYKTEALWVFEHALSLAVAAQDNDRIADILGNIATVSISEGDHNTSIALLKKALELKRTENDVYGQSNCFFNLVLCYKALGMTDEAIAAQKNNISILEELNDAKELGICYSGIASMYLSKNEYQQAVENFETATAKFQICGDLMRAADSLSRAASIFVDIIKEPVRSIPYYQKAKSLYEAVDCTGGIVACLFNIGNVHGFLAEYAESIIYLEQAEQLSGELEHDPDKAKRHYLLGAAYLNTNQVEQAEKYLTLAIPMLLEQKEYAICLFAFNEIAKVYSIQKRNDESIKIFVEGSKLAQTIGHHSGRRIFLKNIILGKIWRQEFKEAILLLNSIEEELTAENLIEEKNELKVRAGIALAEEGAYEEALPIWKGLLEHVEEEGNKYHIARFSSILGFLLNALERRFESVQYYDKALRFLIEPEENAIKCIVLYSLGHIYFRILDLSQSIAHFDKALQLYSESEYPVDKVDLYNQLSLAYQYTGYYTKSEELLEKAIKSLSSSSGGQNKAILLSNLGLSYMGVNKWDKAIETFEKALALDEGNSDLEGQAKSHLNIAIALYNKPEFTVFKPEITTVINPIFSHLESAREIAKQNNFIDIEAKVLGTYGVLLSKINSYEEALPYFQAAKTAYLEAEDQVGVIKSNMGISRCHFSFKEHRVAIELLVVTADLAEKAGLYEELANVKVLLANVTYNLFGDAKQVVNLLEEAIPIFENILSSLVREDAVLGYVENTESAYSVATAIYYEAGNIAESFTTLEKLKARAFREILKTTTSITSRHIMTSSPYLLKEEHGLLQKINQWQVTAKNEKNESFPDDLGLLQQQLKALHDDMALIDPLFVEMRRNTSVSASELIDLIGNESDKITILEYFYDAKQLYIFIISSREKELKVKKIPIAVKQISGYVFDDFYETVIQYPCYGDMGSSWQGISQYLIEPVKEFIFPEDTIYIVPFGNLHYIPFHALEINGRLLIEQNSVAYLPNASSYKYCRWIRNSSIASVEKTIVYGSSFEKEADVTHRQFQEQGKSSQLYINSDKRSLIKTLESQEYKIIHFSCHGFFNSKEPLESGICINNDEELTSIDIFNSSIKSDLVTLSACDTGMNQRMQGDELIGLTRAFFYAGVPSLVVGAWKVDGEATSQLMKYFYDSLGKGISKSAALREAQLKIKNTAEYEHPYYWAGFSLIGYHS